MSDYFFTISLSITEFPTQEFVNKTIHSFPVSARYATELGTFHIELQTPGKTKVCELVARKE